MNSLCYVNTYGLKLVPLVKWYGLYAPSILRGTNFESCKLWKKANDFAQQCIGGKLEGSPINEISEDWEDK